MILEVGQKQSFIFEQKEVKKNILNSNLIRWVTDTGYFKEAMEYNHKPFDKQKCLALPNLNAIYEPFHKVW